MREPSGDGGTTKALEALDPPEDDAVDRGDRAGAGTTMGTLNRSPITMPCPGPPATSVTSDPASPSGAPPARKLVPVLLAADALEEGPEPRKELAPERAPVDRPAGEGMSTVISGCTTTTWEPG